MKTILNFPNFLSLGNKLLVQCHSGILKITLCVLVLPISFTQCHMEDPEATPSIRNEQITVRTCSAGDYSVINGRITFDTYDDYAETVYFLTCASEEDISEWSDETEVYTSGKAFREFWEIICEEELTEGQYEDAKETYDGKIIFSVNGDGDDEIAPLFLVHNEFTNLDGEFGIEDMVYKVIGVKYACITDVGDVDPSTVDGNSTTDSSKGLFIRDLFPTALSGGCCPDAGYNENVYQTSNPKKRVQARYFVYDDTIIQEDFVHPGKWVVLPGIGVFTDGKSRIRRCFLGACFWNCYRQSIGHSMDINISHNLGSWGISNPVEIVWGLGPTISQCVLGRDVVEPGGLYSAYALYLPPRLSICVNDVEQVFTNYTTTPDYTAGTDCN